MKFECGDLERALAVPELMQEARDHLKNCPACRSELRLWNEISSAAGALHEDWASPELWPRIKSAIAAEPRPRPVWWSDWKVWALAASIIVAAGLLFWLNRAPGTFGPEQAANRDFLTERALQDVEKNEAAYTQAIDRLYQLAQPRLQNARSPLAVNSREKLILLDSAISDVRTNVQQNRFNASLQMELAALYREKERTLQELVTNDRKN
ncbi:MAG TPA: hypothetical protein VN737_08600 [Bryobacteraceae bacterium]|jgi:hypothetical protein|nr:hypothetical protein [Bryobacteraceae bacterium]